MKYLKTFKKTNAQAMAHVVEINGKVMIMAEKSDWTTDWPIKYNDGTIAYDNPYAIPEYLKNLVSRALNYKEQNYG